MKYSHIKTGTTIRAYDYPHRNDCYVEGIVVGQKHGNYLRVEITNHVSLGKPVTDQLGLTGSVALISMELAQESLFENRINILAYPPYPYPNLYDDYTHNRTGNRYRVRLIANKSTTRPDEYPTTVVYQSSDNGEVCSRPLESFLNNFTLVNKESTQK